MLNCVGTSTSGVLFTGYLHKYRSFLEDVQSEVKPPEWANIRSKSCTLIVDESYAGGGNARRLPSHVLLCPESIEPSWFIA